MNMKSNFLNDMKCRLCKEEDSEESEKHLASCKFIADELGEDLGDFKYEDIFDTLPKQVNSIKVWRKILRLLKENTETRSFD